MGLIPPVIAELRASTGEFSAKMKEARAEMKDTEDSGSGSMSGLASVGKGALMGLGAAAVAVAGISIDLAEKFQTSTATVAGNAGITVAAAKKIGDAFLSTGFHSTFSAQQMMDAYGPVAGQLGIVEGHALSAKDALTLMNAATTGAEAGGGSSTADLAAMTATLATTMQVYHLKVGQASDATNTLFNTSRYLGVSIGDLGTSLSRLEPRIAGSGMNLQQTGAFMLELASSAGNGRQAMRLAGTAIQAIISPSTAAQKALNTMGVSLTDSNGKFVGVQQAIGLLHNAMAKLPGSAGAVAAGQQLVGAQNELAAMKTEPQTKALKAQETALTSHIGVLKLQAAQLSDNSAMQAIFGRNANLMASMIAGGIPAFQAATAAVHKQGMAEAAAKDHMKTLHGQLATMDAGFKNLATQLGQLLIPILTQVIGAVGELTGFLLHHKAILVAVGAVIGGFLVVAIGAYIGAQAKAAAETAIGFAKQVAGWLGIGGAAEDAAAQTEGAAEGSGESVQGMTEAMTSALQSIVGELEQLNATASEILSASLPAAWDEATAAAEEAYVEMGSILEIAAEFPQLQAAAEPVLTEALPMAWHEASMAAEEAAGQMETAGASFDATEEGMVTAAEAAGEGIDVGMGPIGLILAGVTLAVTYLATHWSQVWNDVKHWTSDAVNFVRNDLGFVSDIINAVISQVQALAKWFGAAFTVVVAVVSAAWNEVSPIFDTIVSVIKTGLEAELNVFKAIWSAVWGNIQSVVQAVWSILKPIFDTIGSAVSTIAGGISKVASLAKGVGGAVGSVGKLLGFASGGVVPGSPGAATLAVVHGGETVLPVGALTDTQPGLPLPTALAASSGGNGSSGGGGSANLSQQILLQLDGRTLWQSVRTYALQDLKIGRLPNTGLV